MSVHTADSRLNFQLPSLSYIDASWEEPNLRSPAAAPAKARNRGLAAWLSRQVSGLIAWRRDLKAVAELSLMSERELADIGLSHSDLDRVFKPAFNADLDQRAL
jgi:uncharacterized protein YjiS (DUF1127 family)